MSFILTGCVGVGSKGIFGTGVSVALDPRTVGTQIDDGIMDKNLDAKLLLLNKNYFLTIRTQILDGRIFITGNNQKVEIGSFLNEEEIEELIVLLKKKVQDLNFS